MTIQEVYDRIEEYTQAQREALVLVKDQDNAVALIKQILGVEIESAT